MTGSHHPDAAGTATKVGSQQDRPSGTPPVGSLEWELTKRIEQRTNCRIEDLRVELLGGTVVVRGRVRRYYLLQLALAAAQELAVAKEVEIQIAVASRDGDGSRQCYRLQTREA
jgi:hypothetical protein